MTEPRQNLVGSVIASQFRVERLLGQGGMGSVYLAEQLEMGRKVVVKVMNLGVGGTSDQEERFKREAQIVAQLNHPNIVQVHVFGRAGDGQLYLAMEYVPGRTLAHLVAEQKCLPEPRALRIVDQVCSALVEAHGLGLIHRDLKPDNIMLTERHGTQDYVKVLDFGIAKMLGDTNAKLTHTGAIFGTPQYMAPEQAKSEPVDQRTDIYSLGLILYEILVGSSPFSARSTMDFLLKQINEPAPPPTHKAPGLIILPRTESLVMKCLAKAPADRFQSVAELQREVRLSLRDRPDAARSAPTPEMGVKNISPTFHEIQGRIGDTLIAPKQTQEKRSDEHLQTKSIGKRLRRVAWLASFMVVAYVGIQFYSWLRKEPEALIEIREAIPLDETRVADGDMLDGVPVPKGSEALQKTDQMIGFRAPMDPIEVVGFYRKQLAKDWGPVKDVPNGLQFLNPKAPFTYLTVTRTGESTSAYLMANALVKKASVGKERMVFGVVIPAKAQLGMESPSAAMFYMPGPVADTLPHFKAQFSGKGDFTIVETKVNGDPYFVVSTNDATQPFSNFAIMKAPKEVSPGPGEWAMITITKR